MCLKEMIRTSIFSDLPTLSVERVEVLPYHTLGVYKWKALGYDYPLEGIEPPTKERVKNAEMILNGEKTRE